MANYWWVPGRMVTVRVKNITAEAHGRKIQFLSLLTKNGACPKWSFLPKMTVLPNNSSFGEKIEVFLKNGRFDQKGQF